MIDIWIKEGLAITKIGISFKPVFVNDIILPEKKLKKYMIERPYNNIKN